MREGHLSEQYVNGNYLIKGVFWLRKIHFRGVHISYAVSQLSLFKGRLFNMVVITWYENRRDGRWREKPPKPYLFPDEFFVEFDIKSVA